MKKTILIIICAPCLLLLALNEKLLARSLTLSSPNNNNRGGKATLDLSFLPAEKKYRLTLISDGDNDMAFEEQYLAVERNNKIQVNWLARGGFTGYPEEF